MNLDPVLSMPVYADLFGRYMPGYGWAWPCKGLVYIDNDLVTNLAQAWWYRGTERRY